MIIWKKNSAADGDLHEYIFSVMKMYYPLMIDSMCSPSMPYVIVEMATVMRQYSNGLLVFVLPEILEPLRGQLGVPCGVLDVAMAQPLLNGSCVVPIVGQLKAASVAQQGSEAVAPALAAARVRDLLQGGEQAGERHHGGLRCEGFGPQRPRRAAVLPAANLPLIDRSRPEPNSPE